MSELSCLNCSKVGPAALWLTAGTTTPRVQSLDLASSPGTGSLLATMHFAGTDPDDEVEMTFDLVGKNQIDFTVARSVGPFKKGDKQHSRFKFDGAMLV